jgi:nucleoside diphosphate kinase
MNTERSLVMLKPDAYDKSLSQVLHKHLSDLNLAIIRTRPISLTSDNVLDIWPKIYSLQAALAYQEYLVGFPIEVWEVEGEDALEKVTQMKKIVRDLYCESGDVMRKLIHTPDSKEEYEFNIRYLFSLPERLSNL